MTENALSYEIGNVVEADMLDGMRLVRVTEKRDTIKKGQPGFIGVLVSTSVPDDCEVGDDVWGYDSQIISVRATNHYAKKTRWEQVGVIGVDTGICWLGDPCYVIHSALRNNDLGQCWEDFVNSTMQSDTHQFKYNFGRAGLGVSVTTGAGDGTYPVEVRRTTQGRIAEVRVTFDLPQNREKGATKNP